MAEERKSILLRIPPELWERVNRLAARELRSTNAQIEFLLREALRAREGTQEGESGTAGTGESRTEER